MPCVSDVFGVSFSLALPFDLRCDLGFEGLCLDCSIVGTSSRGSTSGRGLAGVPEVPTKLDLFQILLAETGVPIVLVGDRLLTGVEYPCLTWVTSECTGGAPGRLVLGVWPVALDGAACCLLPRGVDTVGYGCWAGAWF